MGSTSTIDLLRRPDVPTVAANGALAPKRRGRPPKVRPEATLEELAAEALKDTKPAAKAVAKAPGMITIPAPDLRVMHVTLKGVSPLICHRFGAKIQKQILDKQMQKAARAKGAKDPEVEFRESLYPLPGKKDKYGFPASGFKKASVSACSFVDGVTKVVARGAFHVLGDLIEIQGAAPVARQDAVRLNGKTADIRIRGEFTDWHVVLPIRYNASVMSAEQIVNLFNTAGFAVGVGEWRPQREGSFGMFQVASQK